VNLAPRESRKRPIPPLRLVVDADSGAVLGQDFGESVEGAAYTDLTTGAPLDPSLFTWDGPVVTDAESRARAGRIGTPATAREEAMQWFRANITSEPIQVPVLCDFTPRLVELNDAESGAFSAPLGKDQSAGWLIRRRRSSEPWPVKTHGYQIAWSTQDFDWACQIYHGVLDHDGIAALQQQLHPEQPVVGTPELVFGGSDGL
jgi:hypothetical protein